MDFRKQNFVMLQYQRISQKLH